jgi:serine/threonine-protein kinase
MTSGPSPGQAMASESIGAADSIRTPAGRYVLLDEIAAGGTATVHLGRLVGGEGFSRLVAIKRLHPHFAKDPEFAAGFLDEARLASRIRHPNVVPVLDVVREGGELLLVMEYVHGLTLSSLLRAAAARGIAISPRVASAIVGDLLTGLHAAHEAKSDRGEPLGIVHRDVSPQNVLVGADGVARVVDFGIAKAQGRSQVTREGEIKGKVAYMPPEQIYGEAVTRSADLYAAGVVLWEALTGRRLFEAENDVALLRLVLEGSVEPPSVHRPEIAPALDAIVMKALSPDPAVRPATAREFAEALSVAIERAAPGEVSDLVAEVARDELAARDRLVTHAESSSVVPLDDAPSEDLPTADATIVDLRTSFPFAERSSVRPRRRSWIWRATLSAAVVVLLIFFALRAAERPTRAGPPTTAQPAPAEAPTAPVPSTIAPLASAAPEATTVAPAAPATTAPVASAAPVRKGRPVVAPKRKSDRCDPPYTIDEAGRKHYKVDCL